MATKKKKRVGARKPNGTSAVLPPPPAGNKARLPIVAIGASAGGLEAFTKLLRALPPEPEIALIFIPHLDPTHESAMVELLSRTTRLPVLQAADNQRVSANSVYVLPPDSDMTIHDGRLHLVKREARRGHHMPIDTFFRSLAEDQTTNAVGVILSGTDPHKLGIVA